MQASAYLQMIHPRWLDAVNDARHDEFEDLLGLFLDAIDQAESNPALEALAKALARACLGCDHLWHDLGLPTRQVLSDLLHEHFPVLAAKNTGNMRWKKFFYLQLCERADIRACRAPSCDVCALQIECFGSEDRPLATLRSIAISSGASA